MNLKIHPEHSLKHKNKHCANLSSFGIQLKKKISRLFLRLKVIKTKNFKKHSRSRLDVKPHALTFSTSKPRQATIWQASCSNIQDLNSVSIQWNSISIQRKFNFNSISIQSKFNFNSVKFTFNSISVQFQFNIQFNKVYLDSKKFTHSIENHSRLLTGNDNYPG